ncbi:NAD(P)H oxidoreductase [Sphingobacterium alkalisoli]|uniref:NAD(P)H oxidoreductase n=1 Tax=Sphingobacterium alkalisoli TaxID=1874115 RepID=A0A4U0H2Z9_9SPHI|nr:NAD(P)H-dependent oxidoreductase [Sphingobacterium alkalisoli]TJY66015.1 NAD(P)H oxidoreductase [Sphingobacterium alkalisoli]GGH16806.1 NAD(P)H oxidoreductase [Sphingobacterium alkalisoli]
MKKILVLMFHPRLESSIVNVFLQQELINHPSLKIKDMYELYPDFNIDIKREQQDLLEADLIIMQHPFFWYAAPPLVKQWIDLVLEHNWAYGRTGDKLAGKKILHIISSGGTFEAYHSAGKNQYTYLELLRPFELTYKLCQMQQLPPYIIPGANKLSTSALENHSRQINTLIASLIEHDLNFTIPEHTEYLNDTTIHYGS